jgi:hypothetical protein
MISSCCSFFCIVVANINDFGLHYSDQINSDDFNTALMTHQA